MPEVVLKPLRANQGLCLWYRRELEKAIEEMARSMLYHVRAAWNAETPITGFGEDASPTATLRRAMKKWGDVWVAKFDAMAEKVASEFAARSGKDFDDRFRALLREAGFTVKWKPTERMMEAYRLVIAENVNLIRSIPQKFLTDVQSAVWTHAMETPDMDALARKIRDNYSVSWRRASLIARDQTHKARAVFEEARRAEVGITEAIWVHGQAGKEPRPEHLKWGREHKRYDIQRGLWSDVDQKWVWPGTAINCRCTSRAIIPSALSQE